MKRVEKAKLQRLIRQSLRSLCEAGLPESSKISIEGLIGITVNTDYIVLVNVDEEIGESEETDGGSCMPHHDTSSDLSLRRFNHAGHSKLMHRTRTHSFRPHLINTMSPDMDDSGQGLHSLGTNSEVQSQTHVFTKVISSNQNEKEGYEFVDINEEDIPVSLQHFQFPLSSSKDIAVGREDTNNFDFSTFEEVFTSPGQTDRTESQRHEGVTKEDMVQKMETAVEEEKSEGKLEDVQASMICITPVVDSGGPENTNQAMPEAKQHCSGSQPGEAPVLSNLKRKVGVLTAIKQEGTSKVKAKRFCRATTLQIEEISDNDVMLTEGTSEKEMHTAVAELDIQDGTQTQQDVVEGAQRQCIEFETFPPDDGHSLLQPGDQNSELCDVDESLFQILPDVNIRTQDSHLPEDLGEDRSRDGINVKGEPHDDRISESNEKNSTKNDAKPKSISNQKLGKVTSMVIVQEQPSISKFKAAENVHDGLHSDDCPDVLVDTEYNLYDHKHTRMRGGMYRRSETTARGVCGQSGQAMVGPAHGSCRGMMEFGPGSPFYMMGGPKKCMWRCHVCGRFFLNKSHYETHMLKHENKGHGDARLGDDIGMTCPYCNKRFRFKSWLDQHITTHTKEKLFHCPYCSKAYTRRRNVTKHVEMSHSHVLGVTGKDEIQSTVTESGADSIVIT